MGSTWHDRTAVREGLEWLAAQGWVVTYRSVSPPPTECPLSEEEIMRAVHEALHPPPRELPVVRFVNFPEVIDLAAYERVMGEGAL